MITRQTAIKLAGLAALGGILAGCGTAATAKPAAPPASTSAPATSVTDANGLACVALDDAGFCPGDDPTPPASPPASDSPFGMDIGTPVHMTDDSTGAAWNVTLNSVKHFSPGQYDDAAPAGTHYVIANVTYTAVTGDADVNEWDWTAKAGDGTVAEVQFVEGGPNALSANTIHAPSKIRGTVVLAIPDNDQGATVVYSAGEAEQASWKI